MSITNNLRPLRLKAVFPLAATAMASSAWR